MYVVQRLLQLMPRGRTTGFRPATFILCFTTVDTPQRYAEASACRLKQYHWLPPMKYRKRKKKLILQK